jgi:hypothetical protein
MQSRGLEGIVLAPHDLIEASLVWSLCLKKDGRDYGTRGGRPSHDGPAGPYRCAGHDCHFFYQLTNRNLHESL